MININTKTNTATFQNKEFEIISKSINNFESVNIELKDRGLLYFLKSDVTIDGNCCYDNYFKDFEKFCNEMNFYQYKELEPTDWYFIRKQETGEPIPEIILNERLAIRSKYENLKTTYQS